MPAKGQISPARKYANNAEKQKAARDRKKLNVSAVQEALNVMIKAFDDAGCSKIVDNLPENPNDAFVEIAARMKGKRAIIAKQELPGARTERARKARERTSK